jgi:hypothetical protein
MSLGACREDQPVARRDALPGRRQFHNGNNCFFDPQEWATACAPRRQNLPTADRRRAWRSRGSSGRSTRGPLGNHPRHRLCAVRKPVPSPPRLAFADGASVVDRRSEGKPPIQACFPCPLSASLTLRAAKLGLRSLRGDELVFEPSGVRSTCLQWRGLSCENRIGPPPDSSVTFAGHFFQPNSVKHINATAVIPDQASVLKFACYHRHGCPSHA